MTFKAKWRDYEKYARSRLSKFYKNVHDQFPHFSGVRAFCVWAFSGAALVLSVSLITSTGPSLQHYVLSLIYNDSASIYGSAYQDGLAIFPEIRQWLAAGLHWPFLVIATTIVWASFGHTATRQLFVSSIVTAVLALMACDLLFGVLENKLSAGYVLENIIADAIGGGVLAFIFVATVIAANVCFVQLQGPRIWRHFVAGVAIVVAGIFLNAATFYVAKFFYQPIPVKLDVVFDFPISGTIGFDPDAASADDNKPFQFFPRKLHAAAFEWRGPADDNRLLVEWSSHSDSVAFDATIEFYADCFNGRPHTAQSSGENAIPFENVRSLSVELDKGMSEINTVTSMRDLDYIETDFGSTFFFWLDRETESKRAKITQFVRSNETMTIWNGGRHLDFFVNAPLVAFVEDGAAASGRTITFKINEKNYSISSEKPQTKAEDAALTCRGLTPNLVENRATVDGARSYFGALIRINRKALSDQIYRSKDSKLKVLGGNGWVSLTGEKFDDDGNSGTADSLNFKGNIASLEIDGVAASTRPIDSYGAFGEFAGNFESSAKLRFVGMAKALRKNSARMNPTKWERLSLGERTYILGILLAIFGAIAGYVAIQIKSNARIEWLSSLRTRQL